MLWIFNESESYFENEISGFLQKEIDGDDASWQCIWWKASSIYNTVIYLS